jgi:hypothetical protein
MKQNKMMIKNITSTDVKNTDHTALNVELSCSPKCVAIVAIFAYKLP